MFSGDEWRLLCNRCERLRDLRQVFHRDLSLWTPTPRLSFAGGSSSVSRIKDRLCGGGQRPDTSSRLANKRLWTGISKYGFSFLGRFRILFKKPIWFGVRIDVASPALRSAASSIPQAMPTDLLTQQCLTL